MMIVPARKACLFFVLFISCWPEISARVKHSPRVKKVVFIVAHKGFQKDEYREPRSFLEEKGVRVVTASDKPGMAIATDGTAVRVEVIVDELVPERYDGIFLIGGPGALRHLNTPQVHGVMRRAMHAGKLYGAICISPRILAQAHILRGKRASGWDADKRLSVIFKRYGVTYVKKPVVVDGDVITAVGPQAARSFGKAIAVALEYASRYPNPRLSFRGLCKKDNCSICVSR